jgi:hypothetical protein
MPAPQPPADPNVKLPPGVAKQAAAAEAAHAQAYHTDPALQPQPQPAPAPAADALLVPQPAPPQAHQPEPPAPVQPQPAPQPQAGDRAPAAEELTPEQWRHRYLSMEGRYKQAATSLGGMQEQMAELGDELMRTQDALQQARQGRGPAPQPQPQPSRIGSGAPAGLTPEEVQAYGPELVDVIQRAARAAIMPDMQNLQSGVQHVGQQVQQVSQQTLYANLDEQVPEWRSINLDPRFKAWCNLPDLYSGQLRGRLLNAAFKSGHAARVTAFFKGFLAEEQATGQLPDPSIQPQPLAVPRQPTIPLEMLTAPGRAKPATGDNAPGAPSEKPIFTRNQIQAFYSAVRQGVYAGREPEKAATEQAIFLAQKEGRVR